ncbi:MAG: Gfo/Idh/MocA family oxidoreductase [Clostridia bacterium]|nr:Gfo/Idh/MocA family oxidoreductase [Clostridia bacterium]
MKVAMIGVGSISGIYLENITRVFKGVELIGVCDLVTERASAAREKYGIPNLYHTMHDAFRDPEVDIILNLTRPHEHYNVSREALTAGKHVYTEKPLGATLDEGRRLCALAKEKGLTIAGAPDTFLGAGIQTCRKLIEDGYIGTPIGSAAFMICRGHESWHPDPAFYYQHGGGPMLDMGPYYMTALVTLMGGVDSVISASRKTFPTRTITSKPKFGTTINVDVSTYVAGTIRYQSGAIGTILTTFDVHYPSQARLEIYGTDGTLIAPDPNTFGGPIKLLRPEEGEFTDLPLCCAYKDNSRGLGLADMARALQTGRKPRADMEQLLHVLEAMEGFETSERTGGWVRLSSPFERAPAMDPCAMHGVIA